MWRELQLAASASADVRLKQQMRRRRLKPTLQTKVRATQSTWAALVVFSLNV